MLEDIVRLRKEAEEAEDTDARAGPGDDGAGGQVEELGVVLIREDS